MGLGVLGVVVVVGLIAVLAYSSSDGSKAASEPKKSESEPSPAQKQTAQENSGSDAEAAATQAVADFYTSAAEEDYGRSSELLTASARRRYFPSGDFERAFGTLERIRFTEGPTAEVSGETATVAGTTIAEHTDRTEQNRGTWTLVNEGGRWKLDDWDVQLVQPGKSYPQVILRSGDDHHECGKGAREDPHART